MDGGAILMAVALNLVAPQITIIEAEERESIIDTLQYSRQETHDGATIYAGKTPTGSLVVLIETVSGHNILVSSIS
jgi:hypothetical protein